jgi:hypothetical protein
MAYSVGQRTGEIGLRMALSRLLAGTLYRVTPGDPGTFLLVAVLLAAAALFVCGLPARRATRVSPMVALRCE